MKKHKNVKIHVLGIGIGIMSARKMADFLIHSIVKPFIRVSLSLRERKPNIKPRNSAPPDIINWKPVDIGKGECVLKEKSACVQKTLFENTYYCVEHSDCS